MNKNEKLIEAAAKMLVADVIEGYIRREDPESIVSLVKDCLKYAVEKGFQMGQEAAREAK